MKILVADDEPMIHHIVGELLTSVGYDILMATNGRQALELARKEQPALIVLDLVMPEMTGFEVVREIRPEAKSGSETCDRVGSFVVTEPAAYRLEELSRVADQVPSLGG